jgi:hypothetical protein
LSSSRHENLAPNPDNTDIRLFIGERMRLSKFPVAIDSDPKGMRIEVNNDYVGQTPMTYAVAGNADRSFNGSWVQQGYVEFVATPPFGQTNLYVQRKAFKPSAFFERGDHIPERIFFDMHQNSGDSEQLHIEVKPQ